MRTISQVAELTGVSTRTLQYYDEIGLLKPSELTQSGYRLYNDGALQKLQQILFFKELGFKLKEINEILQKPDFDKIATFKKQKELLLLKRNRTDRLIQLLDRLEKGEQCMRFKEFDLSDYIKALEDFKANNTNEVLTHFGSVEKYTEAMRYNLEHFSEVMEQAYSQIPEEMKRDDSFSKLASNRDQDVSSNEVQNLVRQIITFAQGNVSSELLGNDTSYCNTIIEAYSNEYLKTMFDTKQGEGASDYFEYNKLRVS